MHSGTVEYSHRTAGAVQESSYSQVYSSKLPISSATSDPSPSARTARIFASTASDGSSAYIWSPSSKSASGGASSPAAIRSANAANASGPSLSSIQSQSNRREWRTKEASSR
jgi:hypothetical protein